MATYATTDQLATWMGRESFESGTTDEIRASLLLDVATGKINSETNQPLDITTDDLVLDGSGRPLLIAPRWPVVQIISLTEDGVALVEDEDFRWSANGLIRRIGACWSNEERAIETTLTHGNDPLPDEIVGLTLSLATRSWDNPIGAQSEQLGDRAVQWRVPGMDLTSDERRLVEKYRAQI